MIGQSERLNIDSIVDVRTYVLVILFSLFLSRRGLLASRTKVIVTVVMPQQLHYNIKYLETVKDKIILFLNVYENSVRGLSQDKTVSAVPSLILESPFCQNVNKNSANSSESWKFG